MLSTAQEAMLKALEENSQDVSIAIGKLIKEIRQSKKLTLAELAARTDFKESSIQRYEAGSITNVSLLALSKIAAGLNVPLTDLLAPIISKIPNKELILNKALLQKGEDYEKTHPENLEKPKLVEVEADPLNDQKQRALLNFKNLLNSIDDEVLLYNLFNIISCLSTLDKSKINATSEFLYKYGNLIEQALNDYDRYYEGKRSRATY